MGTSKRRFITVDQRLAREFECTRTERGVLHIEQIDALSNDWEGTHERGRPTILSRGAITSPHLGDDRRAAAEEARQFAREVGRWIRGHCGQDAPLVVFAASRFRGVLRQVDPEVEKFTLLLEAELTPLEANQLAGHPAVLDVMESSVTGPRALA